MSEVTHLSMASINLGLDAALDTLNGGYLEVYTGTQPASPDVAVTTQTLLGRCQLSATAFGAAFNGVKTANAVSSSSAIAAGTATWFRAFKSDDATAVIDGNVGLSGSGAAAIISTQAITVGGIFSVLGWTVTQPQ